MIGYVLLNHIYYADDLVIFAPSHKGLQQLLNTYGQLGLELDIIFNGIKTMYIICSIKEIKCIDSNPLY